MKNLFLFIILIPAMLPAQSGAVLSDTSFIENISGTFFRTQVTTYENNELIQRRVRIGDAVQLANSYQDQFLQRGNRLAVDVNVVSAYTKSVTAIIRENDQVLAATGVNPLDTVVKQYAALFVAPGWSIRQNGSALNITFAVNASGKLRYTIDGFATRGATLIGPNVIRLSNFKDSGTTVDLYKKENGNYTNLDASILLRPSGGSQNFKTVAQPAVSPEPAAAPATIPPASTAKKTSTTKKVKQ